MKNTVLFKSNVPLAYYFWIILSLFSTAVLLMNSYFWQAVIFSFLLSFFLYFVICRDAGTLILHNDKIEINYYFPILQKKVIEIKPETKAKFDLSYYYFLSSEHSLGRIQFLHPHEIIYFYIGEKKYDSLTIFTSYGAFKKVRSYLEDKTIVSTP